jgi:hypothetical protein
MNPMDEEDGIERMAKRVAIWMLVGLLVSVFWGVMGFLLFNASQSRWTDLYWDFVYVTCPPWLLPENDWSTALTMVLNAVLYGVVALVVSLSVRGLRKKPRGSR